MLYKNLNLGEVFDLALRIYRARFWPYFLLFFAANGLVYAMVKLPQVLFLVPSLSSQNTESFLGAMVIFYLAVFAAVFVGMLANNLLMALVTLQVEHLYAGQALGGRTAFKRLMAVFFPLLLTLLMGGILTGVGFVLCIIPGLVVLVRLAFVAPVFLMEDFRYSDALHRSWALTGYSIGSDWTGMVVWRVSAVMLVGMVLGWVVGMLFQFPFLMIAMLQSVWKLGGGGPGVTTPLEAGPFSIWYSLGEVAGLAGRAVIQPYLIISMVVLYLDTRNRKDGLGLIFRAKLLRGSAR